MEKWSSLILPKEKAEELFHGDTASKKAWWAKAKKRMIILFAALALLSGCLLLGNRQSTTIVFSRPGVEEGTVNQQMDLWVEGENETVHVTPNLMLSPQEYEEAEAREYLAQAKELLPAILLGENASFDEVRNSLSFPETITGLPVTISWDYDARQIAANGTVQEDAIQEQGTITQVTAILSCSGFTERATYDMTLYPAVLTEEQLVEQKVEVGLSQAEEEQRKEEQVVIPQEVSGYRIIAEQSNVLPSLIVLLLLSGVLVIFVEKNMVQKEVEQRREALTEAYPDFVDETLLYLRAGLSVPKVLERLESDYRGQNKNRYLHQEIQAALNEMKNGIPPETALERFGNRCVLPSYRKFSFLLEQNMRSGTDQLPVLLEYEAQEVTEQRRSLTRKKAEEAGTKLLLPMMGMLIVVFLILLVPAMQQL